MNIYYLCLFTGIFIVLGKRTTKIKLILYRNYWTLNKQTKENTDFVYVFSFLDAAFDKTNVLKDSNCYLAHSVSIEQQKTDNYIDCSLTCFCDLQELLIPFFPKVAFEL